MTLLPFSTALLAHFPTLKVALVEYWLNIVVLGFMLLGTLEYGLRAHRFDEARQTDKRHRTSPPAPPPLLMGQSKQHGA